ncbi:SGNH/GDSL hydrolase family protein [Streptomyces caatingaensis]|uniref:Lipase n=1 Tax=Streptomyces caatingaensis TaxID=1678637 RepID=A0A0K9XGM1_9ACTN|nr:lipase [Streptomyces caatingaensis]
MGRRPVAVAAAALAALLLGGPAAAPAAPAAPAPAAPRGYVALGDSYSSGVGAGLGSYDRASGACKRNAKAYPALWAAAHTPSSFADTACRGATVADVTSSQLGPLGPGTGLVSITAGANDAGFAEVMGTCAVRGEEACLARIDQARTYVTRTLPGTLDALYTAIRRKAPAARVVVLGYPRFYRLKGSCVLGMTERERSAVNDASDVIDAVLARRAHGHGFVFADVRPAFAEHGICSRTPWLHSLTLPVEESYHPTAEGQAKGYLPVFARAAGR